MLQVQPWITLTVILIGNCGFWLFCFNRINATGLPRKKTKKIEKIFIILCFALPAVIAYREWAAIATWLGGHAWWPSNAPLLSSYGACCAASALILGPGWIESRLWIIPPGWLKKTQIDYYGVHQLIDGGSPADRMTTFLNCLPGNQISDLEVTRKELCMPRSIDGIDGFRIGHLSDLHFTGQYRLQHYHFILDRFLELKPDLIVITGDIIDYDKCLPWIEPLLGRLTAPLGCAFILGNHDRRLSDVSQLTKLMQEIGHFDLGADNRTFELACGTRIEMYGNERPWLSRHQQPSEPTSDQDVSSDVLRIGLSHSPDQIVWARRGKVDLLLAGHTHGGQVRFPGIGPLVAPSRFGSRYASGVFYLDPTLMHVSRGIAGTHPLRFRCPPEVSLLTLRS